jgi:hypothetical protein
MDGKEEHAKACRYRDDEFTLLPAWINDATNAAKAETTNLLTIRHEVPHSFVRCIVGLTHP